MDTIKMVYSWIGGTSALAQLIQVVLLAVISYTVLMIGNGVMNAVTVYAQATTPLLPILYDSTIPQMIPQDPNQKGAITIYPSVNAPTGLEFSYSCFLLIDKSTFQTGTTGLKHIFHKGSSVYKPLMAPGVFVRSNDNVLVVYMNEAEKWNSYCEIPNLPIGKFFHLAIIVRNMAVDIYINGNITHRMKLDSVPRQNFGNVYTFKNESFSDKVSSPDDPFIVLGAASGKISTLSYAGYALNYEQIDQMVRAGPSTKSAAASQNLPPYLADNWWVTYYKA